MNYLNKTFKFFALVSIIFIALSVFAHDAWVEPGSGSIFKILYGHKIPEPYNSSKVTSLKAYDASKRQLLYSRIKTKEGLTIKITKGKPAFFTLEFDNGYWVKVNGESRNIRKSKMPAGVEGTDPSHPLKFSKTILSWQQWMSKPQGQRIEFIPQDFSGAPQAGSQLKLKLLLDGKPLAGQRVENNSNEQGPQTDEKGFVMVTVLKGINRFATDYDIKQLDNPDAQRLSLTAALVFIAK